MTPKWRLVRTGVTMGPSAGGKGSCLPLWHGLLRAQPNRPLSPTLSEQPGSLGLGLEATV